MKTKKLKITLLDAVLIPVLAVAGFYIIYRVNAEMNYSWNWSIIPQYLFRFDPQRDLYAPNVLMQGFLATIRLSFWATLLALVMGTFFGLFRTAHSLFKRLTGGFYVGLVRNIPPLVWVFIFYFFISDQLMPLFQLDILARKQPENFQNIISLLIAPPERLPSFISAIITLALYEGAYIAEIVRGGIQSIDRGQWEAGASLGLTRWQQLRKIILPQTFERILPPLAGQFISTIKDSAIVSLISIQELTFQGMELMAATYRTFEIWITVTALYFLLTFTCSMAVSWLERYLAQRKIS
ncbi:MAG: amino acid ABC transporter permease [Desulfovibrionales bacterium]